MSALPRPHAIIFDWDNTLVNTWPIIHSALNATFEEENLPLWTMEDTMNKVRKSMRDSFPEIFGEHWQKAGERYQAHYRKLHLSNLEALPGAVSILENIAAHDLSCFVVSNKKGPNLRQEVTHLDWNKYFTCVIGADDAARDKPHPDPVHLVLENTDIKPSANLWFVGDSDIDLACAEATGCTGILYGDHAANHPEYTATHLQGAPYHAHVRSHADLILLLEQAMRQ